LSEFTGFAEIFQPHDWFLRVLVLFQLGHLNDNHSNDAQPMSVSMTTRTSRKTLTFSGPFSLKGVDQKLPAGDYRVVTDEELIEGLSFPVYRRVSTMILVPAQSHQASSVEMVTVDPADLQAALEQDAATRHVPPSDADRTDGH
jgi:hypothetical protein